LVESAVHLCGSEPVEHRWQPEALAALLWAYNGALRDQGVALERVPWLTLIAALRMGPGAKPASPDARNDLAGVLHNRGIAKDDGGDLAGAIADYDAAIGLMETIRDLMGEACPVPLRDDLARALQNRGIAKLIGGDLVGALADHDAAIELREAIRD